MEWHPERKCESGLLETNLVHVLRRHVFAYLSPAKAPKLHPAHSSASNGFRAVRVFCELTLILGASPRSCSSLIPIRS